MIEQKTQCVAYFCFYWQHKSNWLFIKLLFGGYSLLFLKVGQFTLSIVLVLEIEMVVSWFGHYIFENVVL